MKRMQVREAKAAFSSVVEAAENGETTMITKHGKPAAVVIPVGDAERLYANRKPNLGTFLMSFPGGLEFERNDTPLREIDL